MESERESIKKRIEETISSHMSKKPTTGFSLDEVDVMDTVDPDWDPNGNLASLSSHEDSTTIADIINGVEIKKLEFTEYYGDYNFGAIDGSSGRIMRQSLAVVFTQSAFASNSSDSALDLTKIMAEDFKIIPFAGYFLKESASKAQNIIGFDKKKDMVQNVDSRASYEQATLEVKTIPLVMKEYGKDLDFLGIDGPLYARFDVNEAASAVSAALPKLIGMFAIVKRTASSSILNTLRSQLDSKPNQALKEILGQNYFNDTSFFVRYLQEGHRSLFFEDRSTREEKARLPPDLTRVCCYLKLDNRKLIRIEIPRKVAYSEGDLSMAEDIVNKVYWQSKESSKPLPNYFHLADEAAKLPRTKINEYTIPIDSYLREIGDSTIDSQEWKREY